MRRPITFTPWDIILEIPDGVTIDEDKPVTMQALATVCGEHGKDGPRIMAHIFAGLNIQQILALLSEAGIKPPLTPP